MWLPLLVYHCASISARTLSYLINWLATTASRESACDDGADHLLLLPLTAAAAVLQHSAAIISDLIVPPNNLPASRRLVTAQFEAQVSAAALIMDKLANRNNKRSVRRAKRKAEQRKVAAAEAKQDYVEVDADEDDEQAQGVKSPLQLVKDFAAFEQDNQRRKTLSWHYWTGGR